MVNSKISALSALTKSTVASNDVLPIVDTSTATTKNISYQELMDVQDNNFRVSGSSDNTKKVAFEVDGLTTATTRTITVPDSDITLVGTTNTQTISGKTLTSPKINVGADATGDMYYRDGSGNLTRLPIGSSGQILDVSGSGIPEWVANPSAANSSSTVKGVVELATSAEINAGTATGGTGAALVVTPDALAASAPAFSALNLTNVKPTVSLSNTPSTSISGTFVTTTQNIDTAITMNGTAKTIVVNFWLKGFSGSGAATYSIGTAIFDGSTCRSYFSPLYDTTATTISATSYTVGNSSPTAGSGASNGIWSMSIQSLSSTGFTFRLTYTQGSTFNGGDYKATVYAYL